jgi:hypothetical protein
MAQIIKLPSELRDTHWRDYDRISLSDRKHPFALALYSAPSLVGDGNRSLLIRVEDVLDQDTQKEIKARLGGTQDDSGWIV